MAKIKPLFRVLAIVNALLLMGAYVCYRGGIVQAIGAKAPERPVQGDPPPVVQTPTPPKDGETPPAPESTPVTNTEAPRRTEINNDSMFSIVDTTTTPQRQELLGGSKSIVMNIEPPAKAQTQADTSATPQNAAKPAPRQQSAATPAKPATPRSVFMGGSKSAKVSLEKVEAPAKSAQPAAAPAKPSPEELEAIKREILMGGSKSEMIYVETEKPASQAQHRDAQRQQSSQSAPTKPRKIMGGSKSAPIEIDLDAKE